jgi:hypothetical protein
MIEGGRPIDIVGSGHLLDSLCSSDFGRPLEESRDDVLADRLTTTSPDVLRELLATFIHTLIGSDVDDA